MRYSPIAGEVFIALDTRLLWCGGCVKRHQPSWNAFDFICSRPKLPHSTNNQAMLTEDDIRNALKAVKYPGYSRDVVSFGLVKEIAAGNGAVSVSMQLTTNSPEA